ncbi:Hypp6914 [Branchiostoma lanceolatum]|uniref:Hypp6914 protein n=1 Tax=Branchiostoma lanceolatum TaxID=7740 RepID=A0A8J9YVS4_BRALA|nr:Hypp6914 [Branchiostoma lanceolatum]
MGRTDTTRPLQLYYMTIFFVTIHTNLCSVTNDQAGTNDDFSPFWAEEEANGFLQRSSRQKRGVWEECYGEGCRFSEAAAHFGWTTAREYLYHMACNKWPCWTGCCERANPAWYPNSGPWWRVCNTINECLTNKGGCREDQYCVDAACGNSCPACTAIANCRNLICTNASNH